MIRQMIGQLYARLEASLGRPDTQISIGIAAIVIGAELVKRAGMMMFDEMDSLGRRVDERRTRLAMLGKVDDAAVVAEPETVPGDDELVPADTGEFLPPRQS